MSQARSSMIALGTVAPDFRAPTSNGQTLGRENFLGKVPVALVFPDRRADTTTLLQEFDSRLVEFGHLRVQVLGVVHGTARSVRELAAGIPLPSLTLLADEDASISEAYASADGCCVLIDSAGLIREVVSSDVGAVDLVLAACSRLDRDGDRSPANDADHAELISADTSAEVSTTIAASRSEVWDALTDPEAIKRYFMGATVTTDWQVGSPITWSGDWKGTAFEDKGAILQIDPQRFMSYSHWSPLGGSEDLPENYHVLKITLDDAGDGTRVTLAQSNLVGTVTNDDRVHRDDYEKNWSMVLDGLKQTAEG